MMLPGPSVIWSGQIIHTAYSDFMEIFFPLALVSAVLGSVIWRTPFFEFGLRLILVYTRRQRNDPVESTERALHVVVIFPLVLLLLLLLPFDCQVILRQHYLDILLIHAPAVRPARHFLFRFPDIDGGRKFSVRPLPERFQLKAPEKLIKQPVHFILDPMEGMPIIYFFKSIAFSPGYRQLLFPNIIPSSFLQNYASALMAIFFAFACSALCRTTFNTPFFTVASIFSLSTSSETVKAR